MYSILWNFLFLWSGFINPPLQFLIKQDFPQIFERLFSKKNREKNPPHQSQEVPLRFFSLNEFIRWHYVNYSNITDQTKEISFILKFPSFFRPRKTVVRPASKTSIVCIHGILCIKNFESQNMYWLALRVAKAPGPTNMLRECVCVCVCVCVYVCVCVSRKSCDKCKTCSKVTH